MLNLIRRFTPSLYTPDAPLGQRISNKGLPTTNIARMYHSTATLTPKGYVTRTGNISKGLSSVFSNILIAGSNPGIEIINDTSTYTRSACFLQ